MVGRGDENHVGDQTRSSSGTCTERVDGEAIEMRANAL